MKLEEVWEVLRRLESRDYSEARLGTKEKPFIIEGNFNRIDLSKASGWVTIKGFVNILDASNAQDLHLELVGKFNFVDLSGAKVELNRKKAEINIFDASGASGKW